MPPAKKTISCGYFTTEEDKRLIKFVNEHGTQNWSFIASKMETRNARQCRERWKNYLAPEISNEPWTSEEDQMLLDKHKEFGKKWSQIAKLFNKRTDINVKNRFNFLERQKNRAQNQFSDRINSLIVPVPSQPPALIQFSCVTNVSVNLISNQITNQNPNQTFIQQPMTSIAQNLNVTTNLRSFANVTNTFISTSLVANQGLNQPLTQTSPSTAPPLSMTTDSDNFGFGNHDYVFDFELDKLWWPYSD